MPIGLEMIVKLILLGGMVLGLLGLIVPAFPGLTVIWVLVLVYGLLFGFEVKGAIFFTLISIAAVVGMLSDNVLMIGKARQGGARWLSIFVASVAGVVGSILLTPIGGVALTLLALYLMELLYRRDRVEAWESTKNMALGWGWAFVIRFGLGMLMLILWGVWELSANQNLF
ncbi:MAG: DUF456 domain-containing protein [Anaerolineae bacterium]|nr:DUF456 domain-containing protein [Anaerolineae bacterium]